MNKKYILIFFILISLNFVYAGECWSGIEYCNPNIPFQNSIQITTADNESSASVNNSQYLQGYNSSDFWKSYEDQTGLTGNKKGSYILNTSGIVQFDSETILNFINGKYGILDITGKTWVLTDSNFSFEDSIKVSNFICNDDGCFTIAQFLSPKMNYTHIIMGNQTNNESVNLSDGNYFVGQPITGAIGSGIIWANETNNYAEVNISCSGLTCSWTRFKVRLVNTTNDEKYCDIPAGSQAIPDNQQSVLYVDNSCVVQLTSIQTYVVTPISPGGIADFANIIAENGDTYNINGIGTENKRIIKLRKLLLQTMHLDVINGFDKQEGTFPQFNITAGNYVYLMDVVPTTKVVTGTNKIEGIYHTSSTTWGSTDYSGLNTTWCDTGTTNQLCTNTNLYRRVFIFMIGYNESSGNTTKLHQLLPSQTITYSTLAQCLDTVTSPLTFTIPSFYQYGAVMLWAKCLRPSDTGWTGAWIDLRTTKQSTATGGIDTTLFLTKDGATPLTGSWQTGGYNITNISQAQGNISNFTTYYASGNYISTGNITANVANLTLINTSYIRNSTGNNAIYVDIRQLMDKTGVGALDWGNRQLKDNASNIILDWNVKRIYSNWTSNGVGICLYNGTNCPVNSTANATYNNLLNQNCPAGKVVNGTLPNGTFICTTASGGSMNYTNIAMKNESNNFTGALNYFKRVQVNRNNNSFDVTSKNNAYSEVFANCDYPNSNCAPAFMVTGLSQSVMGFYYGPQNGSQTMAGYAKGDNANNLAFGAITNLIFEGGGHGFGHEAWRTTTNKITLFGTQSEEGTANVQVLGGVQSQTGIECQGNITACEVMNITQCNLVTGCTWDACSGSSTGCGSYGTEGDCGTYGCSWHPLVPAYCTNPSCADQTSCTTEAGGCGGSWIVVGGTCNDNPGPGCGVYGDSGTCNGAPEGCLWSDTFGCSVGGCGDQPSCERAAGGCGSTWNPEVAAFCDGTSYPCDHWNGDSTTCGLAGCSTTSGCSNITEINTNCNQLSPLLCNLTECNNTLLNPSFLLWDTFDNTKSNISDIQNDMVVNTPSNGSFIVKNASGYGTVIAGQFLTASKVPDTQTDYLAKLDNMEEWLYPNGSINYDKHYANTPAFVEDETRWIKSKVPYNDCKKVKDKDGKVKVDCNEVMMDVDVHPLILKNFLSVEKRLVTCEGSSRQLDYKVEILENKIQLIKHCTANSKDWNEYQKCIAGV